MTFLLLCLLQATHTAPPAPPPVTFLPRAAFGFSWDRLATTDRRFEWQGRVGFDFDAVDYRRGRVTFRGDYTAVLGRERRRYDLNQGTYYFDIGASARAWGAEWSGFLTHVSRHLVDRENQPAVSWNAIGIRARRHWAVGGATIEGQLESSRAMQQAFVDYTWIHRADVAFRRPFSRRAGVFGTGWGVATRTDPLFVGRSRVCGARVEGGLRIDGDAAAVELYAAYERRLDAFPVDRFRVRFFAFGFRVLSR